MMEWISRPHTFFEWKSLGNAAVVFVLLTIPKELWFDPWRDKRKKRWEEADANKGFITCDECRDPVPPWFIGMDTGETAASKLGLLPSRTPGTRCGVRRHRAERRGTGITLHLDNHGKLEDAQRLAGHADARTTRLYDRRTSKELRDEVERVQI